MQHASLLSSAACPGFLISFVSSLFSAVKLCLTTLVISFQHCALSKVFHVWYQIRVSYLWN